MTVRRNILASWLAHAVTLAVGLFLVRYVKGTLGDAGYGAWIFVSAIAGYSGLLYMGFGAAVCRYSARYHALEDWTGLNRVLSSIFALYAANSLLAAAAAGACAVFAPWISDWEGQSLSEVRVVLTLLGLNAAVGLWGSVFSGLLVGIQRFDVQRSVMIGCTLVRAVLVVGGLSVSPSLLVMALSFLAVTALENAAYYVAAHRLVPQLGLSRRLVSRETFRECGGFTAFNALGMVSEFLISLTDTVVIGVVLGTAATVPYYIAQRLCQMIRAPLEHVAEVVLPRAGALQTRQEHERLRLLVLQASGVSLLLVAGFSIGSAYFASDLLDVWLGPGNEASPPILMVLLTAQIVAAPLRVPRMALMGLGEVRAPALFDVLQAMLNLALSLVLVRSWGAIGVAWGTLGPAVLCEVGLLLPCACRRLGLEPRRLLMECIVPQLPALAALWAYCESAARIDGPPSWLKLLSITVGGGAVLAGVRGGVYWLERRQQSAGANLQEATAT